MKKPRVSKRSPEIQAVTLAAKKARRKTRKIAQAAAVTERLGGFIENDRILRNALVLASKEIAELKKEVADAEQVFADLNEATVP